MTLAGSLRRWLGGKTRGVALALGGGGARGLAHVGVLTVLEAEEIPVACVVGSSAGAIVGAMWLAMGSAAAVEARWREFLASDFPSALPDVDLADDVSSRDNTLLHFARTLRRGTTVALALGRRSLVENADFDRALAFLVPEVAVEDLPTPFGAVATEFASGRPVTLCQGPLRLALAASSAIPGVLAPYRVGGRALWDGGVVADVPVREALAASERPVVAVDVSDEPTEDDPDGIKVPRAMLRAGQMTQGALRHEILREADLVVRPAVGGVHWSEFARMDECIEAGRSAALESLDGIRRLTRRYRRLRRR